MRASWAHSPDFSAVVAGTLPAPGEGLTCRLESEYSRSAGSTAVGLNGKDLMSFSWKSRPLGSRSLAWLSAVTALLLVWAIPGPVGYAETHDCDPSSSLHYFEGTLFDPPNTSYIDGSRADINVRRADLCQEHSSFSLTSSMVAERGFVSNPGWAQVGYIHRSGQGYENFAQSNSGNGQFSTRYTGSPALDSKFEYRVARPDSDGHFYMQKCQADNPNDSGVNCTTILETSWDEHNIWEESESHFFGETPDQGSDIPGSSSNNTNFSMVREKQPDNDWINGLLDYTNGGRNVEHYRFEFVDQRRHFKVWTYPINR